MDVPENKYELIAELIHKDEYERIAELIHSDSSPVGIDAKKTHIMLLYMVERLMDRVEKLGERLDAMEKRDSVE